MALTSNCTNCLSETKLQGLVYTYSVFAIEGIILSISNLTIFGAIAYHRVIRKKKQYIVIAGLALINGINGLACLIGGLSRLWFIYHGTANVLYSQWECFWTPFQQLWVWTDVLVTVMLTIVSVDRVIAVMFPVRYFKFKHRYALVLVGSAYFYTFVNVVVAGYLTYPYQKKQYPQICISAWTYHPSYYEFLVEQRIFWVAMSVILYVFVVVFYGKSKAKVRSVNDRDQAREAKVQSKMTKSMGISCAITVVFFLIPMIIELSMAGQKAVPDVVVIILGQMFTLCNLDSLLDLFIFTLRHKDLKLATLYMFKCKELTQVRLNQMATSKQTTTRTRNTKQSHKMRLIKIEKSMLEPFRSFVLYLNGYIFCYIYLCYVQLGMHTKIKFEKFTYV